jgi:hypothetical protein
LIIVPVIAVFLVIIFSLVIFLDKESIATRIIPSPDHSNIELNGEESMVNENEFNFDQAVRDFLTSIGTGFLVEHQILIEKYNPVVSTIRCDSAENEIAIIVLNKLSWHGSTHLVDPLTKEETDNPYLSNFAFVSYQSQFKALYDCRLGSNDFPNAQKIIFYIIERDLSFCSIELEPVLTQRLLSILEDGPETEPFTCAEFVFYMMGLDYVGLGAPSKVLSQTKIVKWHEPTIGTMLFFSTGGTEFRNIKHWAMYIEDKLTLSLFGHNLRLQIADVEQIFKAYQTKETYMICAK